MIDLGGYDARRPVQLSPDDAKKRFDEACRKLSERIRAMADNGDSKIKPE